MKPNTNDELTDDERYEELCNEAEEAILEISDKYSEYIEKITIKWKDLK